MKKNITLILGLSIPLLMIAFVALSIYLPRQFSKPTYDFVYVVGRDTYYSEYTYSVVDGKLTRKENPSYQGKDSYYSMPVVDYGPPKLFYYTLSDDSVREISFEEAQTYTLNNLERSPDGYEFVRGGGAEIVPFGGSYDYNSFFIRKGSYNKRLDINIASSPRTYSYYDVSLIGWVIK